MGKKIKVVKAVRTCDSCPAQWSAWDKKGFYIYARYRYGYLSIKQNGIEIFGKDIGGGLDGSMSFAELKQHTKKTIKWPDEEILQWEQENQ
jgi:hypothetical protein